VANVVRAVVRERDRHDVEPAPRVPHPQPLQVVLGEPRQAALLPPRDGRGRRVAPRRAAALHLDEDVDVAITADQVDLAFEEPHVAPDDAQTRSREVSRGGVFGIASDRPSRIRRTLVGHASDVHRRPRASIVSKFSDGRGGNRFRAGTLLRVMRNRKLCGLKPTTSDQAGNTSRRRCRLVMRPDANTDPTPTHQLPVGICVAPHVLFDLLAPPGGVRLRPCAVLWATVPEAAVDEHGDTCRSEHEVGASSTIDERRTVYGETEAKPMKC
jgi:hypothetical protein